MRRVVMTVTVLLIAALFHPDCAPGPPSSEGVSVDGTPIAGASSTIDNSIEVTEYREGSNPAAIRLQPGLKRYGVCVVARGPVAVLDAVFPMPSPSRRVRVGVEDGRAFVNCLVANMKAEGSGRGRRFTYCLRCEDVTPG